MGSRHIHYLHTFTTWVVNFFFKFQWCQWRPLRWRKQAATWEKGRTLSQGQHNSFLYALTIFPWYEFLYTEFSMEVVLAKPYAGLRHFDYLYKFTAQIATIFRFLCWERKPFLLQRWGKQAITREKDRTLSQGQKASFLYALTMFAWYEFPYTAY